MLMKKSDDPVWVSVAVDRPIDRLFTYRVPEALAGRMERGIRVKVPFGRSHGQGVVVGPADAPPPGIKAKAVTELLEETPLLTEEVFSLLEWVGRYYGCPLGEVAANCFPLARLSRKKRIQVRAAAPLEALQTHLNKISKKAPAQARILAQCMGAQGGISRPLLIRNARAGYDALRRLVAEDLLEECEAEDPFESPRLPDVSGPPVLTDTQKTVIQQIREAIDSGGFAPFLLQGVTGSGKTEVYLKALEAALASGGQGLVLLPEIALTPQTFQRFACRFSDVVLLHSLLAPSERSRNMHWVRSGRARIVIGARSAVFAPFSDLRLIVVDEEHESSFKQETAPRYHARDVAVYRASRLGIPIILGSATPSLETYRNAETGRYGVLHLPERVTPIKTAAVRIVDLSIEKRDKGWLSQELLDITAETLKQGKQAIYFLNRRGFARMVKCIRCGYDFPCQDCSVGLTYHKQGNFLLCHTCGHVTPRPESCPQCNVPMLRFLGAGTERIVRALTNRFPSARIGRLDRDTASSRTDLITILSDFSERKLDILVGTQMVAKGHDFPEVTLVGVICADMSLNFPDFRASERTFQLVHQVGGRAGRGDSPGRVVLQTYSPKNRVIQQALSGEFDAFAREELAARESLGYPPYGRLLKIILRGRNPKAVHSAADFTADLLREKVNGRVLGPALCPVEKIKGRLRLQIIIKAKSPDAIGEALNHLKRMSWHHGVQASWDVDPVSFL